MKIKLAAISMALVILAALSAAPVPADVELKSINFEDGTTGELVLVSGATPVVSGEATYNESAYALYFPAIGKVGIEIKNVIAGKTYVLSGYVYENVGEGETAASRPVWFEMYDKKFGGTRLCATPGTYYAGNQWTKSAVTYTAAEGVESLWIFINAQTADSYVDNVRFYIKDSIVENGGFEEYSTKIIPGIFDDGAELPSDWSVGTQINATAAGNKAYLVNDSFSGSRAFCFKMTQTGANVDNQLRTSDFTLGAGSYDLSFRNKKTCEGTATGWLRVYLLPAGKTSAGDAVLTFDFNGAGTYVKISRQVTISTGGNYYIAIRGKLNATTDPTVFYYMDDFELKAIATGAGILKNGENTTKISGGDEITAQFTLSHSGASAENEKALGVLCIYRSGGGAKMLVALKTVNLEAVSGSFNRQSTETVKVPSDLTDGNYSAEVFLWNSLSEINPLLIPAYRITE